MQQTAQYEIEVLNDESISEILAPFKGRHVKISIEEVVKQKKPTQLELYEKALEVRERFKNSQIDPNINLSELANGVNL